MRTCVCRLSATLQPRPLSNLHVDRHMCAASLHMCAASWHMCLVSWHMCLVSPHTCTSLGTCVQSLADHLSSLPEHLCSLSVHVCSLSNLHADRHSDEATSSPQNATSTKSIKVRNSNSYIQIPSCRRRREGYRLACLVISHDLSLRMWCAITTPIATHLLCYHQTYRCFVIRRIVAV